MATAKSKAKPSSKKPAAKKSAARNTPSREAYTQTTWALMIVWLGLVAVFLGLIVFKLYLN